MQLQRVLCLGFSFMVIVLMSLLSLKGHAQTGNDEQDEPPKMTTEVMVTDMENNPRQGEKVVFVNKDTEKKYSGVTNKNGKFVVELPGASVYEVKVKALGESQDTQTFKIPALPENRTYGKSRYTIKYSPAKVFTLDDVHFDVNKATLRDQSYEELKTLKNYLERRENIRVEIAGHTDNAGDKEHNQKLSERRAQRVKQYLTEQGIDPDRLETKGYGESRPVATNNTKEGRQKNRRTEVHIISE